MKRFLTACMLGLMAWAPISAEEEAAAVDAAPTTEVVAAEDELTADAPTPVVQSGIGYYIDKGGAIVKILIVLAIIGALVATERVVTLFLSNLVPAGLVTESIEAKLNGGAEAAKAAAEGSKTPLGEMVVFASAHIGADRNEVGAGMADIAARMLDKQLQKTYWLSVVATLAPLLGLLGTVLGMISAFQGVALAGDMGDVGGVASGISEALITTAAGLIVAVPALAAYHFFRQRVMGLAERLSSAGENLLDAWYPIKEG